MEGKRMFIFNKTKHFDKVINTTFNYNMKIINVLNEMLTCFGAKPYIEKDANKFVSITFLHVLFLQECVLQKKYYPKYKNEVSAVFDAMIYEIAKRCNYKFEALKDIYFSLRNIFDKIAIDDKYGDINLYYRFSVSYIFALFNEEYKPEEHGFELGETEYSLANVFQSVMTDTQKYLK